MTASASRAKCHAGGGPCSREGLARSRCREDRCPRKLTRATSELVSPTVLPSWLDQGELQCPPKCGLCHLAHSQ